MSKVVDFGHFGVVAQVIRHEPRVCVGLFHPDAQCFERQAEHPAGMGIQLGADGSAQRLDAFREVLRAERGARNGVGVTLKLRTFLLMFEQTSA
jgi:hypothetical protein